MEELLKRYKKVRKEFEDILKKYPDQYASISDEDGLALATLIEEQNSIEDKIKDLGGTINER